MDRAELLGKTGTNARVHIAINPGAVGYKSDDALVTDPVRGPTDCHLVGVIEAVLKFIAVEWTA